ncbi:MAG: hypothetical protein ACPGJS_09015 [Flammeovirgaceae bacterium]
MIRSNQISSVVKPLALLCFFLFLGRSYQHLFWDAPYRTLLWDEAWLEGMVNWFGLDWKSYVTSAQADRTIQLFIKLTGILYLVCALICLAMQNGRFKRLQPILKMGILSLAFLFFLTTKERFFHIGQFLEHSAQLISPILLLYLVNQKLSMEKFQRLLKIAIALTFSCHGLYAIGYYPRPGVFVDMTINIFGCSEAFAHQFLWWAGLLDFVVALFLFIPHPKFQKTAIYYTLIWGLVTALARTVAFVDWSFPLQTLHQNLYQTIFRLPHAGLPFILGITMGYFFWKKRSKQTIQANQEIAFPSQGN